MVDQDPQGGHKQVSGEERSRAAIKNDPDFRFFIYPIVVLRGKSPFLCFYTLVEIIERLQLSPVMG